MTATIIDGKQVAADMRAELKEIHQYQAADGHRKQRHRDHVNCLAAEQVGEFAKQRHSCC